MELLYEFVSSQMYESVLLMKGKMSIYRRNSQTITSIFSRTQFQEVMSWYISFKWRRNMIVEKKKHITCLRCVHVDRDKLIGEVYMGPPSTCTVKVYFFFSLKILDPFSALRADNIVKFATFIIFICMWIFLY